MLRPCVDRRDAACLFQRLDRESRWAVSTIHKTLLEMREIVDASYPEGKKQGAYGSWGKEALSDSATTAFEAFCERKRCLDDIASGFGAVRQSELTAPERAVLTTTRARRFEMAKYDGAWGLATYQKELLAAKLRLIDSLKRVEKNAKAFEEQRRATGSSK